MLRLGIAALAFVLSAVALIVYWHKRHSAPVKPVQFDSSEGFADLVLPVRGQNCDARGGCTIDVEGEYKGSQVGIRITFAPDMEENKFEDLTGEGKLFAQADGIILEPKGERGQNFVRLLSTVYNTPITSVSLPLTIRLTALPLEGNPRNIGSAPLKFKTFHHDDEPDASDYFELFIDPDLKNGIVRFNEKDTDYRKPILRAFGATF